MKEAFRLLNKSIIRVEQPDVHLDEDEGMGDEEDEPMDTGQSQGHLVIAMGRNCDGNLLIFSPQHRSN